MGIAIVAGAAIGHVLLAALGGTYGIGAGAAVGAIFGAYPQGTSRR